MPKPNLTAEQASYLRVLAERQYALHPLAVYMQVHDQPTGSKLHVLRTVSKVFRALYSAGYVEQRTTILRGQRMEMYMATEHGREAIRQYDAQ